jgi:HNH endonuclease
MIPSEMSSPGSRSKKSWSTPATAIPPSVFAALTQTNSSPEVIALSLNEAEWLYSSRLKKPHKNAKRVYPFWKTCQVCSEPFPCLTKEQAVRSRTCSRECLSRAISTRPRKLKPRPLCGNCGQPIMSRSRAIKDLKYCSSKCWATVRFQSQRELARLREIAKLGRAGWTEDSLTSYRPKMTGANNPAWKGGVTYFRKHGLYAPIKYVRCPLEWLAMARKDGYVMEHRLLVAQALGRCLLRVEVVHHINHDPTDNRLVNLQLFASNQEHKLFEHHGSPAPIWSGSSPSSIAVPSGASASLAGLL